MYIILFSRFEQGYCYFGNKCTLAHGDEECTYWKASYQLQTQQLAQFQEKRLLTENFSENVYRRIKHEGEHYVVSKIFIILWRFYIIHCVWVITLKILYFNLFG